MSVEQGMLRVQVFMQTCHKGDAIDNTKQLELVNTSKGTTSPSGKCVCVGPSLAHVSV